MSNSSLINYTRLSPNCNKPRNHNIDTITIHHMAGNLTVEQCGSVFAPTSRKASSNYGIGTDGRVGLYVDEANRSWCSSSYANDNRAITIEVANDQIGGNWHVSDTALEKLIDLCVDICKRNGITKLNYTGNKSGNLTMHKWFAATACPGPYLESKFLYISQEVNAKLTSQVEPSAPTSSKIWYRVRKSWSDAATQKGAFHNLANAKKCADNNSGYSVFDDSGKTLYPTTAASKNELPYKVKVTIKDLNIRKGPGTNYQTTNSYTGIGVFTIIAEADGTGATKWGKLKSGAGWISLDFTTRI